MLSSIVPALSTAAIPEQTVTLTISPFWLSSLFLTALALTCGVLWFLAQMDRESHRTTATAMPLRLAFPPPSTHGPHESGQAA